MNYLVIAVVALLVSILMIRGALWLFPKWGLMDRPHKYGLKRAPIPYYGGIAIVAAFIFTVLIFLKLDFKLAIFLLIALGVAMISFIDDRRGLSPYLRLLMQLAAGVALFFGGIFVTAIPNPIGPEIALGNWMLGGVAIGSLLATVLWVVLIMNTMNWVDGLNGLPSGISTIAALVMFALAVKPGIHAVDQSTVAVMALILGIVALVFCFHDFYPAKILMGDTGSMFLGFVLAGLAIYSGGKLATAILVLGFPILDAFWVILRRIFSGNSPFKGDLMHFHHRLQYAGFTVRQALLIIYLACLIFGVLAIFLDTGQKLWALLGLMATMAIFGFIVVILEVEKKRQKR
ncbi:undecaprenyl/decaprenyl-phosphate alpha-N-acetylglucosaminyl 1-phosphate transferase [Candidatus Peregrinibacteria bacterium]|nr:undecaprenyl/decaprenyl-phosphate alpha-N-acetylglucosaminyl 1-phosphate transferase [Candidatus Peregrinibacteria bacterium]